MTDINLLPWREAKREQQKKQFMMILFAGLIMAVVVVFFINYYALQLVGDQTTLNHQLESEITTLKSEIVEIKQFKATRAALIARMNVIKNLQATRILTVRLFDELIKIMPDGVFLNHVDRQGDKITLLGYAESNSNISQLMRNIEHNPWIDAPELTEIKKATDEKPRLENEFKLSFKLKAGKV